MPRIKLIERDEYRFAVEITVRTTDLNYGGHLGNDRLLSLVHEARVAFLAAQGWTELDCAGTSLILGDAAVVYRAEAFAGDMLRFEVDAGEATSSGFRLYYRASRPADGTLVALVENGMACFDYTERRVAKLPPEVAALCG